MVALALLVVLSSAASAGPAVDEAWCARARELLADAPARGDDALARFEEAAAALFHPASMVVARARAIIEGDDDFALAFAVLAGAADESCARLRNDTAAVDGAAVAAEVRELMARDGRFAGVRRGDDALDRLRHQLFMWFSRLLETEGMQRFAGGTRTIFFAIIALVAMVMAVRVARRLRRRDAEVARAAGSTEAARAQEFASLRAHAELALQRRDARAALLAGQQALLARVGERAAQAVRPTRTHRELLALLAPTVARAVAPALGEFERALFAKEATVDDATRFLALVDDAAARLHGAAPPPSGAP